MNMLNKIAREDEHPFDSEKKGASSKENGTRVRGKKKI